jgi:hypothetical protein
MVHTVRPILRGRGGKKEFLVHFVASAEFDLQGFILELRNKHGSVVVASKGASVISLTIKIKPAQLRQMVEDLPRHVQVAYEEKEPEKC